MLRPGVFLGLELRTPPRESVDIWEFQKTRLAGPQDVVTETPIKPCETLVKSYVCQYTHTYIYIYMYIYIHICLYTYIYRQTYVYIYIYRESESLPPRHCRALNLNR